MNVYELIALSRRYQGPKAKGWCPHTPHPKQAEFVALDCLDALFGGAAGGGKSDALLMAALQYAHVPGYAALILRRTYADLALPNAIMDRARQWIPAEYWNDTLKRFKLPCPGGGFSTLTFGFLDTERDRFRYQGAELQFVGIDELTQFPEKWATYLFSRLRKPITGKLATVPLRFRGATNPGGTGHEWVRRRYIDSKHASGVFVPSSLVDNPAVDAVAYRESLAKLDETTRRQLEDGSWIRDASGMVYAFDRGRNTTEEVKPTRSWTYLLGIDYGFRDATALVVLGWPKNSTTTYVVHVEKHARQTPSDSAESAARLIKHYDPVRVVGDMGGLGKGYAEEARKRFALPIVAAQKTDKRGYISLLNGALERAELVLLPGCEALAQEWLELPWDDDEHTKEAPSFENHAADACLYAWRESRAYSEPDAPSLVTDEQRRELAEQAFMEADTRKGRGRWDARLASRAKR